jgi:SAM-dependent methyltransferase
MLVSDSSDNNYFLIDDNQMYKSVRAYNSYVKTFLLETIINPKLSDKNKTDWLIDIASTKISNNLTTKNDTEWIIDLASGKGQDLGRINNLGFKNGLFIDNDKNALLELINRKYSLRTQNSKNMKIFTQEINLTTNYKEIIKRIEKFNINKESIDVIICNFAIHYIIENDENLLNLIQLLNFYLKPNGRFIFTCFNGKKVFKLLENTQQWDLYDNNSDYLKYSIKKLYTSKNLNNTGQKIDVLLPFSKQKYYTEYLINIDHVNNVFNDNNFTTEISESFTCLLNNFKTNKVYNSLSNQDKEFIDLYQFTILKKNYNNNIIIKSNIASFFNCKASKTKIDGGLDEEIDEEIKDDLPINYLPLYQLNNINNSNAILLFINTIDDSIIKYIINNFENMNYKNKNINKRNKNKIVKVIGFEGCSWIDAYKEFYANNIVYDSIIFYDYKFKKSEDLNTYIIKKPIAPIILTNSNMLLIISINDLENLLTKETIEDVKFISNSFIDYNLIKDNYLISKNKEIKLFINKYYDSYTV